VGRQLEADAGNSRGGEVQASYTPALKGALLKNVYWTWTNYREGWRRPGRSIWCGP
jgi:hypothetical protein